MDTTLEPFRSAETSSVGEADPMLLLASRSDEHASLVARLADSEHLAVWQCPVSEALGEVRRNRATDLILVDATSDQMESLELCRRIKQDPALCLIPVILMVDDEGVFLRDVGLRWGVDDCLTMPAQEGEAFYRCRNLIRGKRSTDTFENSEKVILTLARMIEGRDAYTQGHVERVAAYAVQFGTALGLDKDDLTVLHKGGIAHDLGKLIVPDAVLNKPGPLTEQEEWDIIKRHPVVGHDLLAPLRTFHRVLPLVRWHHEKPNGQGYPDGIGGDELPLTARIIAVADCFDALTTRRPYREALPLDQALDILQAGAQKDDFDPDVVGVLMATCGRLV